MRKNIKEFYEFISPPDTTEQEQLVNSITDKIRMFGYYPLDKITSDFIDDFSNHLITRLKNKKEKHGRKQSNG